MVRLRWQSFVASVCMLSVVPFSGLLFAQETKSKGEGNKPAETPRAQKEGSKEQPAKDGWRKLIVSRDLEGWENTKFGGDGSYSVNESGELIFEAGQPLTGITYKKEFPKENFEIRWQANRLEGSDFLVGLTFPVGDEHCSFICGGWGGGLAGISSIDGNDASENQTTQFRDIKNNKWYRFVVKVDSKTITVTMDGEQIIEVPREGKSFTVRGEVRASRPLGYCVFASKVAVKDFEYRSLAKEGKEGK